MFLTRVIERYPKNQWYLEAPAGWTVLDSDGNSFSVTLSVLDSDGNSFNVSSAVLDSDGNSFSPV